MGASPLTAEVESAYLVLNTPAHHTGRWRGGRAALFLPARGDGESAGELLRTDADEAELAPPRILAVVEEGQE
jgi:hypothetical protein